jgi:hypothetical protein
VKALQKLHWSAAAFTRDGLWIKLYVRGFSPEKAAKLAAREYDANAPAGLDQEAVSETRPTLKS